jgi:hypothetical protein
MHSYQAQHGQLPTAVVYGEDDKPLLSWRVSILPYIEQEELFKEFKLDEPWDSPHNIKLLPKMPTTYAPPPGKMKLMPAYHTIVHVFVGKGAAFEGRKRLRFKDDFTDGTSNTILLIEAGKPVPWTKPEDLIYDPDGPLPDLTGIFSDGIRAGMGDGSTRSFGKKTNERTWRAAITRNGGDKLGPDWLE